MIGILSHYSLTENKMNGVFFGRLPCHSPLDSLVTRFTRVLRLLPYLLSKLEEMRWTFFIFGKSEDLSSVISSLIYVGSIVDIFYCSVVESFINNGLESACFFIKISREFHLVRTWLRVLIIHPITWFSHMVHYRCQLADWNKDILKHRTTL